MFILVFRNVAEHTSIRFWRSFPCWTSICPVRLLTISNLPASSSNLMNKKLMLMNQKFNYFNRCSAVLLRSRRSEFNLLATWNIIFISPVIHFPRWRLEVHNSFWHSIQSHELLFAQRIKQIMMMKNYAENWFFRKRDISRANSNETPVKKDFSCFSIREICISIAFKGFIMKMHVQRLVAT